MDRVEKIILSFLVSLVFLAAIFLTWEATSNLWRDEAAQRGCAEYYLDATVKERTWRWLDHSGSK